ncbi:MAG: hypothetical protein JRG73_10595 [Deltaproteobacteria bacterium]|nr:hypothetical protein [Deltaproteobacteria bacterium]MBW2307372.1 hypothetical protein [Deltaproteobacteria bacterium]
MERCGADTSPFARDDFNFMERECFGFGLGKIVLDNAFSGEPSYLAELLLLAHLRAECKSCDQFENCVDFIFEGIGDGF